MDATNSGPCAMEEFIITGVEFSDYTARVCCFCSLF
jgi:hypothetical protein